MLRSRIAAVAAAGLLGLGLTAASPALADGSSQAAPTVTQTTPGSFTVDLPGVGSLTFNVDSAGAVSNVVATPATGFTAGTPAVTSEGVQVMFTGTDGTMQTLQVEVENEDGVVKVKAENDQPDQAGQEDQADSSSTTPTTEAEHEDGATSASTTPTTEAEHEDGATSASTTPTTEAEHEDNTTTTTMQSNTQSSDNTSSDGGSSDGGSSDGGSSDGGSTSGSSD